MWDRRGLRAGSDALVTAFAAALGPSGRCAAPSTAGRLRLALRSGQSAT